MTSFKEVALGDLFDPRGGRAKFIRDYIDRNSGGYPVYSASLNHPFGYVHEYDYEGHFLTWVMNGYGGRVQEVSGRFSANRDRGVLVPREGVRVPNLTYLRFVTEPQLSAAAVGRRVDGRLNEYTKIYPETAKEITIRLPVTETGEFDFDLMDQLGERFKRVESCQADVRRAQEALSRVAFSIEVAEPSVAVGISDIALFRLSIGERVLSSQLSNEGVPVYSANAITPFGKVEELNASDFSCPSLLWGIDGIFDWNIVPSETRFAHTDHCGRLQILDDAISPEYVFWFLKLTRKRYGFDRVYRASLENMKAEVMVTIPLTDDRTGFSLDRQRTLATALQEREASRSHALAALEDTLRARVAIEA